ncbi:MAG: hypothetical protein IKZ88_05080 [Neisseriaceae bacterium]|nr:hypothetical protein [Neisseriaceae bacterium]
MKILSLEWGSGCLKVLFHQLLNSHKEAIPFRLPEFFVATVSKRPRHNYYNGAAPPYITSSKVIGFSTTFTLPKT